MSRLFVVLENVCEPTLVVTSCPSLYSRVVGPFTERVTTQWGHPVFVVPDSSTTELTFDHVIPVTQGGRKDWENIVTCCVTCNRRKGGQTPAEAGMKLLRPPRRPTSVPAVRIIKFELNIAPESWRDFLYWHVELDDT